MSTSQPRLASASWIHSSFSLTLIRCHSFLPLKNCSWRPTICQKHYKILIQRYHSLTSGMTPSQRSQHWRKCSNSNFKKLTVPYSQLLLPRSLNEHASPRHPIQSQLLPCLHASAAPEEISDNNSRSRHNQHANTSEGGHTNDESAFTSEGAKALTKSCSPQLVPRRLLRHGHCPHGHRPGKSPLVPGTSSQCSRSPHHRC
jgi:hypothetical protein